METVRRRWRVSGRVQGVFFRASTVEEAERLEVVGWVANQDDGTVEVVAEGGLDALDALGRWLTDGPSQADVDEVEATDEDPEGLQGFEQR